MNYYLTGDTVLIAVALIVVWFCLQKYCELQEYKRRKKQEETKQ